MRSVMTEKADDFFFFFSFHLYETTETCSGSTKMEILTGKMLKSCREKSRKVTLPPPPPEKFSSLRPCLWCIVLPCR